MHKAVLGGAGRALVALGLVSSAALAVTRVPAHADPGSSPDKLSAYAHATDDYGRTSVPTYAGTTYDATVGRIDVYLTQLDLTTEQQLEGHAPATLYTFHQVPHSETDMDALTDEIAGDLLYWQQSGVLIQQWGPDPTTGLVTIGVTNPVADTGPLTTRYGAANISVIQGMATMPATSRLHDAAPWNGGDFITAGGGDCTSGPPVTSFSTNVKYLFTAGHCFGVNATVHNASTTFGTYNGSPTMGSITNRPSNWNNGGLDIELLKANSSSLDWRTQTASEKQYTYNYRSLAGDSVCQSGAFETEVCGNVVQNGQADICNTYSTGQYSCHLAFARNGNHSAQVAGQGDSGSPTYSREYTQGLNVRGIMSGFSWDDGSKNGPLCSINNPNNSRHCGDWTIFTNIGYALDKYNVGLN